MKEQVIITTIDSRGVARLTMNRPQLKNAFNEELIGGICDAMGRLNADQNVRAIVLTGREGKLCAGFDLTAAADDHMLLASLGSDLRFVTITSQATIAASDELAIDDVIAAAAKMAG